MIKITPEDIKTTDSRLLSVGPNEPLFPANNQFTATSNTLSANDEIHMQLNPNETNQEAPNPYFQELDKQQANQERSLIKDELTINNAVGSFLNDQQYDKDFAPKEGYIPYVHDREMFNQVPAELRADLLLSESPEELRNKLTKIHEEGLARENIAKHGAVGMLGAVAAGIMDPINLVPIVGKSTKAKMAWGAATTALDEGALQATQEMRTKQESAINIGTAAVMTGVLSAIAKKWGASSENTKLLTEGIQDTHEQIDFAPVNEARSVNAAATPNHLIDTFTPDDTELVGGYVTKILSAGPLGGTGISLMKSSNPVMRELTNEIFDHGLVTKGNVRGKAVQPVEGLIRNNIAKWTYSILEDQKMGYDEFVQSAVGKNVNVSKAAFNKLVQRELRYGDIADGLSQVGITGIKRGADTIRKMLDDYGKILHEHGKISDPNNVYGANHFLPRDYQKGFARLNADETIQKLATIIENKWKADPEELALAMEKSGASGYDLKADAIDAAKSIYNNIINGKNEFPSTTGRRKLRLPDTDLMFLINDDPYEIALKYLNRTAPKIELLNKYGTYNADTLLKNVLEESTNMKLAAKGKDAAIENQYKKDIENFKASLDRLMGNTMNTRPTSYNDGMKIANNFLVMTKMGKAAISSITDIGATVMINGPIKTMEHYGRAMLDWSDVGKLQAKQANRLVKACDQLLSQRSKDMEEILSSSNADSKAVDVTNKMSEFLMRASGLTKWTSFGQGVSGTIAVDKILTAGEKLAKNGKISQSEITFLAQHGLTKENLIDIYNATKMHGDVTNRIANNDKWGDEYLSAIFGSSVIRMADTAIVRNTASSLPAFMDIPEAKLIFKFMSFGWNAWQRITIAGLQRHDANFLWAATAMTGLGIFRQKLYAYVYGSKDLTENDSWDKWVMTGVNNSGLGLFPATVYDKFGAAIGLSPTYRLFDSAKTYGYKEGQSDWSRVIGVAAQPFQDAAKVLHGITSPNERYDQEEIDAQRRLTPYNNLWYTSFLFDQFNKMWAAKTGVPYKTKGEINKIFE